MPELPRLGLRGGGPPGQTGAPRAHFDVEVVVPDYPDYLLGEVIGDLSRRRGRIERVERRGNSMVVASRVPLSEMFGYATHLRSHTHGRATYTMRFESYDEVPPSLAEKIAEIRIGGTRDTA